MRLVIRPKSDVSFPRDFSQNIYCTSIWNIIHIIHSEIWHIWNLFNRAYRFPPSDCFCFHNLTHTKFLHSLTIYFFVVLYVLVKAARFLSEDDKSGRSSSEPFWPICSIARSFPFISSKLHCQQGYCKMPLGKWNLLLPCLLCPQNLFEEGNGIDIFIFSYQLQIALSTRSLGKWNWGLIIYNRSKIPIN